MLEAIEEKLRLQAIKDGLKGLVRTGALVVEAFLHIGNTGDLSTSIRYVNTAIAQLYSYAEWDSDQGELYGCFDY